MKKTDSISNGENIIDWDAAADALKADYTEVSFDGTAYYMRA